MVFDKLKQAGLTVKPSKCQFARPQCVYLGHIVGNGVVKPQIDKVEAIHNFPQPITKKGVRSFLG